MNNTTDNISMPFQNPWKDAMDKILLDLYNKAYAQGYKKGLDDGINQSKDFPQTEDMRGE